MKRLALTLALAPLVFTAGCGGDGSTAPAATTATSGQGGASAGSTAIAGATSTGTAASVSSGSASGMGGGSSAASTGSAESSSATGAGGSGGALAVSDILVPSKGAWWGAYARASAAIQWSWATALTNFETDAGRKMDLVYRYHDWGTKDNGVFPDQWETAQLKAGYIVNVAWESRTYTGGKNFTWAEIANGSQDAVIDAAAMLVKGAPGKMMVGFDHEMDNTAAHSADGPDADYVAAYRHIVDRFKADGVTNVVWMWTPMGWSGTYNRLPNLYPGDDYVDWLGYDPYNFYTCNKSAWKDPAATFGPYYQWMHDPAQTAWHAAKPFILSEYSSNEDAADAAHKGAWMQAVVDALKLYPDIKAVQLWDSTVTLSGGFCNLVVDSSAASVAGYAAAGSDPYVNQPH